jgi:dTDP-4-amino-4,6-dideoxy-D-galactose acyltransferase
MRGQEEDAVCEWVEWDSTFFGLPIGRVRDPGLDEARARHAERWAIEQGIRCLYLLVDLHDMASVRLAEQHDYRLVDVQVTFEAAPADVRRIVPVDRMPAMRPAQDEDIPACEAIARRTFRNSRFHNDPGFTDGQANELYATWIRRSIEGWADFVTVLGPVGDPYGFMSCHRNGKMGLSAVREDRRGRGEGRALYQAGFDWFEANRVESILMVTQGANLTSQRMFHKAGVRLTKTALWYHRWFDTRSASLG